jgi:hypothetical protein
VCCAGEPVGPGADRGGRGRRWTGSQRRAGVRHRQPGRRRKGEEKEKRKRKKKKKKERKKEKGKIEKGEEKWEKKK